MADVTIIGAGLTGLAAAHMLTRAGVNVTVYEQSYTVGGHARSEWMHGIPYEPHGPHIFHTTDRGIWQLVTSLTPMLPYRHQVLTELAGEMFAWPLQLDELNRLDDYGQVVKELAARPLSIDNTNFETWCISQMGETLYGLFIDGYTTKQWGRPGSELSADIGPKRVELRRDGNRNLFRDPYQGWPAHGYGALADALAADTRIVLGEPLYLWDLPESIPVGQPVIVTAPLDTFCGEKFGPLDWRGVHLRGIWLPGVGLAQPAMVVNCATPDVPYTRTIETKHVLGYDTRADSIPITPGTMLMYEHPGAPARHYPVPDATGTNKKAQLRYEQTLRGYQRNPIIPAGRLAHYTYINMDEAIRQGIYAATHALSLEP